MVLTLVCSVGAGGCSPTSHSAAAEVSGEDVRRLPPDRKGIINDPMHEQADRGRTLGADSARAVMLVISDYQCDSCRTWFERTLPALRTEYIDTGRLRLAWTHYPLRDHPAAVRAASAALCASVQGKFWEASAALFANTAQWAVEPVPEDRIDSFAAVPGVDAYTLRNCTTTNRMLRRIRMDIDWADTNKVGMPLTVFIAGRRIPGSAPLATLRATIDSVLAGR
jgi:hypothetical protein